MRLTYKFRLAPTSGQAVRLQRCVDAHRQLYNAALQERRDAWRHPSKTSIRYGEQSAQLKDIRAGDPDGQGGWSFSSQQATLRRLNKAFDGFFRRAKTASQGVKPGYPRFKGAGWFDSVEWPKDGDGCRWDSQPQDKHLRVYLLGVGHVKVRSHRAVQGRIKTVSVKREGVGRHAKWFVVVSCDDVPTRDLGPARVGGPVGIDVGVEVFLATHEGELVDNPRFVRTAQDDLATAQQSLSRKKRGSNNRARARRKVAAVHAKVKRQRTDFHHKTALTLLRDYNEVFHENLNIAGMTRTPKPVPDPDLPGGFLPNGAAGKTGLNRSILDAGWSAFLSILTVKAESAGRSVDGVNAANTSRTCPLCGNCQAANRPTRDAFRCLGCGHTAHADVNAAVNILGRGLASQTEPHAA